MDNLEEISAFDIKTGIIKSLLYYKYGINGTCHLLRANPPVDLILIQFKELNISISIDEISIIYWTCILRQLVPDLLTSVLIFK